MLWYAERSQDIGCDVRPVLYQRRQKVKICVFIGTQSVRSLVEGAKQDCGLAVIKRMGGWSWWSYEFQSVLVQRQRFEEG